MKLRKSLLKVTSLTLVLPLLMSNSPRPYPREERYEDYELTAIKKSETGDGQATYDFTLKNTGTGYISGDNGIHYSDGSYYFTASTSKNTLFGAETLVFPGQSITISETVANKNFDFSKERIYIYAYKDVDLNVKYEGTKSISKIDDNNYEINLKASNFTKDYNYYFAIGMSYKGEFVGGMATKSKEDKINFNASETFNENDATITDVVALRYPVYKGGQGVIISLLVILGVFLLLLISPAIVLPIVFSTRKRRRKAINSN